MKKRGTPVCTRNYFGHVVSSKRAASALTLRIRKNICPTSKRAASARTRNYMSHLASCKRAQMKLSFGMIFSIFLIVVFLSFAIYAIIKFIDMQQTIQIETFKNNLQADINLMWQSQQGSQAKEYYLPNKINAVCFTDDDYQNLMFKSEELIDGKNLEHLNIEIITSEKDPYCIENMGGKVGMTLVKEFGESLVKITK